MSITPKAIQDLLDELEASKQSRLRAWNALQRLRSVLSEVGNVAIPAPTQKTFEAEGEILEHALTKSLSRKREWENLQELRWVLQDSAGMKLPPPAKRRSTWKAWLIKDGVRKAISDRQNALHELLSAINQYRKLSEANR
jgi:hypothetical protein